MPTQDVRPESTNEANEDKTANAAKWWLLEAARRIPAMKYGIGLVGVVAVVALCLVLTLGRWQYAVFGGAVVIAGMVILRIYAAWQPKVTRMDISGPAKALIWTIVVLFVLLLSLLLAWFARSLFWGDLSSLFTPERRMNESFGDFVNQVKEADNEGPNALAGLVEQYHGSTIHWVDCIVVEVIALQKTYRLTPSENTPDKYQAMAGFGDNADFKSFKKGQKVNIDGVFDTVSPFAIILYNCRFSPPGAR